MKTFLALIPLLALAACSNTETGNSSAAEVSAGIVGGQNVMPGTIDARPVALLANIKESSICTSTLISEDTLLTAAHCVSGASAVANAIPPVAPANDMIVIFSVDPMNDRARVVRKVVQVLRHEGYTGSGLTGAWNDVALVRFVGGRPANTEIAQLPADGMPEQVFPFRAIGYGRSNGFGNRPQVQGQPDQSGSGVLRFTDLKGYFVFNHNREFVTDQRDGHGVCQGDSGGPAMIRLANGKPIVLGVVSRTSAPGVTAEEARGVDFNYCNKLAIYSAVIGFKPWILSGLVRLHPM